MALRSTPTQVGHPREGAGDRPGSDAARSTDCRSVLNVVGAFLAAGDYIGK